MLFPFFHIDVFTDAPYQGNPASVTIAPTPLSDEQMQRIAHEIGLPGNGFVWPASTDGTLYYIRFFTPKREVMLSGHTTLACAHALFATQSDDLALPVLLLRSKTATLVVEKKEPCLWLTLPLPALREYSGQRQEVVTALRLTAEDLCEELPMQLTPDNDLLIPLKKTVAITAVTPDLAMVGDLGSRMGVRGFCLFTTATIDPDSHTHSRFFAPHFGIPEDSATGSVHGPLAFYLWRHGLVQNQNERVSLVCEQGHAVGRPSRLYVELTLAENEPQQVRVGGAAATVVQGSIR